MAEPGSAAREGPSLAAFQESTPVVPRRVYTPGSPAHSERSEDGSIRGARFGFRSGGSGGSGPRSGAPAPPEASPLLAAIRREVEAAEDRLGQRVVRIERHTDQFREAADRIARQEEKLADAEATQLQYDRRLAELGGSMKGITEELQSLVKRVGGLDTRIWEAQRHSEELFRARAGELEQDLQAIAAASRLASTSQEDVTRRHEERIQRLQGLVDELTDSYARQGRRLDVAEAQLELLSDGRSRVAEAPPAQGAQEGGSAASAELVTKLQQEATTAVEAASKATEAAEKLAAEVRRSHARAQEQEAQIAALLGKIEAQDVQLRALGSRLAEVSDNSAVNTSRTTNAGTGATAPEEKAVDKKISALEEKLFAKRGQPPATRAGDGGTQATEATAGGRDELRAEVASLAEKVSGHGRTLEEVQRVLLGIQRQSQGAKTSPNSAVQSLAMEVRALVDCISSGEAAVRALAPRLMVAAAAGDLKLSAAARELQAACNEQEKAEIQHLEDDELVAASVAKEGAIPEDDELHAARPADSVVEPAHQAPTPEFEEEEEDEEEEEEPQQELRLAPPRRKTPKEWLMERLVSGPCGAGGGCFEWLPRPSARSA